MGREAMPTPVMDLSGAIPEAYKTEEGKAGALMRIEATLGRKPGTFGIDDEGYGLAASHYHFKNAVDTRFKKIDQTLGRMPGTNGIEDEGDGIARHVFDQRVLARHGVRLGKGTLVAAATALLVAVTALVQGYAATHYAPGVVIERSAAASPSPPLPPASATPSAQAR